MSVIDEQFPREPGEVIIGQKDRQDCKKGQDGVEGKHQHRLLLIEQLGGRQDVQDVVASDEGVSVSSFKLSTDVFLSLFQVDIHVPVQAGENASVVNARVELDNDWPADDLFQEVGGIAADLTSSRR